MKFACIEYTTKTGKIWEPKDHPNFLGDPINEIDPTSFASYTTALSGKHVPLTGLILGQFYGKTFQSINQKINWKIRGRWADYPLDYLDQFDTILAVFDWKRGREMAEFVARVRKEKPEIVVIGVPTQPFGQLRETWREDSSNLRNLINFFDSCHAIISIVRDTIPYQQSFTKTPIVYVPQPYPAEFASRKWKNLSQKEQTIFVAGYTSRPDIVAGHLASREIQKKKPEFTIRIIQTPDTPLNLEIVKNTKHDIITFQPWQQHLEFLSQNLIVINTDQWWTRGRIQADCAATGTPSVGGPSDAQKELFPDLSVRDVEDFSKISELGIRLIEDRDFYEQVAERARKRLVSYNFAQTVTRFSKLVDCIKNNSVSSYPKFVWENDVLVEEK